MATFCSHTNAKTSTPLFDCIINHSLVQTFPFLNDTLSQLLYILDFPGVDPLLKKTPYLVIDEVDVWTIWRPQRRRVEVGRRTLQQIDHLVHTVSRCPILLEGEVISELFDVKQKFLHQEDFTVVLTIDFHPSINEMKISAPQNPQKPLTIC